jgi:rhodanese-related sulfurtransferase
MKPTHKNKAVKSISYYELLQLISYDIKVKIVDVRDHIDYKKEHIKGAISLVLRELRERAYRLLNKHDTIVIYCSGFHCQASTKATKILLSLGYKNVFDYKGGLINYKRANLPLEGYLHTTE